MANFLASFLLLVATIVPGSPEPRDTKAGFREKIPCVDSGKFYRNPNGDPRLANRKKECAEYYLCIEDEVFPFKCSTGLKFDVRRQICDRADKVGNRESHIFISTFSSFSTTSSSTSYIYLNMSPFFLLPSIFNLSHQVDNCDMVAEEVVAKPLYNTDEPLCAVGENA